MSVQIFSRYVATGNKFKICPFQLSLNGSNRSTPRWKLGIAKQNTNLYILVNSIGCFLLFFIISNMVIQVVMDIRRPFYLGIDISFLIIFLFEAYAQYLCLSNSGMVELMNNFFQFMPRAGKYIIVFESPIDIKGLYQCYCSPSGEEEYRILPSVNPARRAASDQFLTLNMWD